MHFWCHQFPLMYLFTFSITTEPDVVPYQLMSQNLSLINIQLPSGTRMDSKHCPMATHSTCNLGFRYQVWLLQTGKKKMFSDFFRAFFCRFTQSTFQQYLSTVFYLPAPHSSLAHDPDSSVLGLDLVNGHNWNF